jgi:hypothetical protein
LEGGGQVGQALRGVDWAEGGGGARELGDDAATVELRVAVG